MSDRRGRETARATLRALTVSVIGVFPAFLVGALAVQIRAELGIGLAFFGFATATLFAVSGLLGRSGGRLVQRLGHRRGRSWRQHWPRCPSPRWPRRSRPACSWPRSPSAVSPTPWHSRRPTSDSPGG
ncbi:hypothetical protein [Blastococcus brunescens]|uniref:Major facilitator superfamily (MFS) profile domain-containing protein n=1 Tax=Blastococcus brunescens TaxID=1564165 RepID=A0ABZ1B8Z0_9ACTN|nr:hypothetical protein [Blastococcus sp. BMG 8361]WRL67288.1 hypothetical protein U6N30_19980 [Blastococcus sp. BMG 8361]